MEFRDIGRATCIVRNGYIVYAVADSGYFTGTVVWHATGWTMELIQWVWKQEHAS